MTQTEPRGHPHLESTRPAPAPERPPEPPTPPAPVTGVRRAAPAVRLGRYGWRSTVMGLLVALVPLVRPCLQLREVELAYWQDRVLDVALTGAILLMAGALGRLALRAVRVPLLGAERALFALGLGLPLVGWTLFLLALPGLLEARLIMSLWIASALVLAPVLAAFAADLGRQLAVGWRLASVGIRPWTAPTAFAFLLLAALTLLCAFAPPIAYDSLMYHLATPREMLEHGGLIVAQHHQGNYPFTAEMLYLLGLVFGSDIIAHLLHFAAAALLGWAVWLFAARWAGPFAGTVALASYLTIRTTPALAPIAYIDLFWALWEVLAIFALVRWAFPLPSLGARPASRHARLARDSAPPVEATREPVAALVAARPDTISLRPAEDAASPRGAAPGSRPPASPWGDNGRPERAYGAHRRDNGAHGGDNGAPGSALPLAGIVAAPPHLYGIDGALPPYPAATLPPSPVAGTPARSDGAAADVRNRSNGARSGAPGLADGPSGAAGGARGRAEPTGLARVAGRLQLTRQESWLVLAGLLFGAALGAKYIALMMFAVVGPVLLVWAWRRPAEFRAVPAAAAYPHDDGAADRAPVSTAERALARPGATPPATTAAPSSPPQHWGAGGARAGGVRALRAALIFGLVAVVVAAPWYVKNWLWLGSPLYPWLSVAGSANAAQSNLRAEGYGLGTSLGELASLPLRVYSPEDLENYTFSHIELDTPSLLFLLAPLLLFAWGAPRVAWWLLLLFALRTGLWAFSLQDLRYLYPAMALLCVPFGIGLAWVADRRLPRSLGRPLLVLATFLAVLWPLGAQIYTVKAYEPQSVLTGERDVHAYLAIFDSSARAVDFMNQNLPDGSKVLLINDRRTYYLRHAYRAYEGLPAILATKSDEEMWELIRSWGITHIALGDNDLGWFDMREAPAGIPLRQLRNFIGRGGPERLLLLYRDDQYEIYEILPPGEHE